MQLLKKIKVVLNCFEKTFTCLDDKGERVTVKGIPIESFCQTNFNITNEKDVWKGCKVFDAHVMNAKHTNKEDN